MQLVTLPPEARPQPTPVERLFTVQEVVKITTLSRTTIYRMLDAGTFPRPIHLSPNRIGWRASVIARWQAERSGDQAA